MATASPNILVTKNETNGRIYNRLLPIAGTKYEDLTLTGKYHVQKKATYVEILCSCGKLFSTRWYAIETGKTKSCGCKSNELKGKAGFRHGFSPRETTLQHKIYRHWAGAKTRCFNENDPSYPNYGGRGIGMCQEWIEDFMNFYNWAINNGWKKGLTLDRFPNNDGNYEPSNCRWATDDQQRRNKRTSTFLTAFGETKVHRDWARDERCKVSERTFKTRLKNSWEPEDALTIRLVA